ncbi:MAG: hypothetical protein OK439_04905 [Thaumarchaeota archaeon]|nr:hypothetical protein [Nitrososphaerota archaeon]
MQEAKSKNITLTVSEGLAKSMSKYPEVTWSQVAREAIENYLKLREEPDLAPLFEKWSKEIDKEQLDGKVFARVVANNLSYSQLSKIVRKERDEIGVIADSLAEIQGYPPDEVPLDVTDFNLAFVRAYQKVTEKHVPESSEAFITGFRSELGKIYEKLQKVRGIG